MPTEFNTVRACVRTKVRDFCFAGASITDEEIGGKKIKDLGLDQPPGMPGIPPYDGLIANIKGCSDVGLRVDGETLKSKKEWTVDMMAILLFGAIRAKKGETL